MKNIAIIPARGGSKRIPRKNIKDFLGKPIMAYSIESALSSGIFDEVMVSTDDTEIADIAQKYGAKVPFYRSKEMSTDMSMTAPVLVEVLNEYKKQGKYFDQLCCIYPCAPFITAARLKEGMELLESSEAESVLPIVKYSHPPQRCFEICNNEAKMLFPNNYNVRTQDLKPLYHDAGQFYCLKVDVFMNELKLFCKRTFPIILKENEVQDIDTSEDWTEAEKKYRVLYGI